MCMKCAWHWALFFRFSVGIKFQFSPSWEVLDKVLMGNFKWQLFLYLLYCGVAVREFVLLLGT